MSGSHNMGMLDHPSLSNDSLRKEWMPICLPLVCAHNSVKSPVVLYRKLVVPTDIGQQDGAQPRLPLRASSEMYTPPGVSS